MAAVTPRQQQHPAGVPPVGEQGPAQVAAAVAVVAVAVVVVAAVVAVVVDFKAFCPENTREALKTY